MRPLTHSCFLLLLLRGSLCLPPLPPLEPSHTVESISLQGAALAYLDSLPSHDSAIWAVALFLFPLAKAALASSTLYLQQSFLYLELSGRSGRNCLVSPPLLSGCNWSADTHFFPETIQLRSWPGGMRYLWPTAVPCSLSPPTSYIHSFLFLDWRGTISPKIFDTQVTSVSTQELLLPRHVRCVLSRLRCNKQSLLLNSLSL